MQILFTKSTSLMSKAIRSVTGEPVSHAAIEVEGFIIHSDLLGVRAVPRNEFSGEVVFSVPVSMSYTKLLTTFLKYRFAWYDFGALAYLGLRLVLPWLPKKNLWQSTGMFLCTEWVTDVLEDGEDSMVTPYQLYLRIKPDTSAN